MNNDAISGPRMQSKIPLGLFRERNIGEIIEDCRRGLLTPQDLAEACIAQTGRLDPLYHAWELFDAEKLLAQSRQIAARLASGETYRLLEGIPVGVKDIFNTLDFPTQMGSPIWKDFTPGNDARAVAHCQRAGAVIPGKTVTAEFAVHTPGKTLNPHDPSRNPGTSSTGSAVAVALGMVPTALATQTAGSIVRPASFCGVYGCKPSFGLIPRTGTLKTTDSLDTIGFFVTHCADLERMFEALRVHGCDYPISHRHLHDPARQTKPAHRPWRISFVETQVWRHAQLYAQEAIRDWLGELAGNPGIEVSNDTLPPQMEQAHAVHSIIYERTLAHYFQEEFKQAQLVSPIMNEMISRGLDIALPQYMQALKIQEDLCHTMDQFLESRDILVSLSTAGEAGPREERELPDPALIWTMTHLPVISCPVFAGPTGLPFGLQLVARRYNDYLLFKFASYLRSKNLIPPGPNPLITKG